MTDTHLARMTMKAWGDATSRKDMQALILQQLPIPLETRHVQEIWQSGKAMRDWARANNVKLTVYKGMVQMDATKLTGGSVVDDVMKVAERVKKGL